MKLKCLILILILNLTLLLTGCSHFLAITEEPLHDTWSDSGYARIGHELTIQNSDNRLTLLQNKDTLSSEGLYYATWSIGDSEPFENSDGNTVDLYDAHLYLLLGEYPGEQQAINNRDQWLTAGKENYEILSEEEITCNGQSYTIISYRFVSEDNPYDRGISAFGACQKNAVCIELTCREDFEEDLRNIMIQFLNNCTFENQ